MSAPEPGMEGLRLEQAPPLSIPASFFAAAPVALAAGGAILLWAGEGAVRSAWAEPTIALAHVGTLGLLAMVMWGALYQMIPVVVGTPVPVPRLAHAVQALLAAGVACLVAGVGWHRPPLVWAAISLLPLAFLLFAVPVGIALVRGGARTPTRGGMGLALAALLVTVTLGVWMAHGHASARFPGSRPLWMQVHLGLALLGWVGGLLTAVSWQVVPMFYLADAPSGRVTGSTLTAIGATILLSPLVLVAALLDAGSAAELSAAAALAASPGALAVWALHPLVTLRAISRRRRKRADPSLLFWKVGLALGPATLGAAAAVLLLDDPRLPVAFGWLAILGWAGVIVHGMLLRIVPFLVWFHRFSPLVGREPVPSVRKILPDAHAHLGLSAHLAALAAGLLAIATQSPWAARLAGALLLLTALALSRSLAHALRQRPAPKS